jgi:hypothetical protein
VENLTEKEKKGKEHVEELHKVGADTVVRQGKIIEETAVSASNVGEVRKGIVTGSSVGQARKEIEQGKGSSEQSEKK